MASIRRRRTTCCRCSPSALRPRKRRPAPSSCCSPAKAQSASRSNASRQALPTPAARGAPRRARPIALEAAAMAIRLHTTDPDFEARFSAFLATKREVSVEVDEAVRAIVAKVRAEGDAALAQYSLTFDGADLAAIGLAVSRKDIEAAYTQADKATVEAL